MKTIAILGANGRLSNATAKAFFNAGWQIIAITRTGVSKGLPEGVKQRSADALNEKELVAACVGCDVIFNGLNPPYRQWAKFCMPMANNVISAAKENGAVHLFPGNIYNFGTAVSLSMNEQTPFGATSRKGQIRIAMEHLFETSARQGVQTLIIRAGDFFGGPIRGSWFDLVITKNLHKGKITYPGPFDVPHAWAYLPDLAMAFVEIANRAANLQTYDVFHFGGHTLTGAELQQLLETTSATELQASGMPWSIIRLGGKLYPAWREISEISYLWSTSHSLDGRKLNQLIGTCHGTDVAVAVERSILSLR